MAGKDTHDHSEKRSSWFWGLGFLNMLSEIEQLSVAERNSTLPDGALPPGQWLSYFGSGVEIALLGVIVTAFLSPFMFAVHEGIIPVFGSYDLTTFDRVFTVVYTTSFPLGTALFGFSLIKGYYCGNSTKKAVNFFAMGLTVGSFFTSFAIIVIFHILYYRYLTPEGLVSFIGFLPEFLRPGYRSVYLTLRFFDQLIPSAYFQAVVSFALVTVIYLAIAVARIKTRRIERQKKVWQ